MWLIDVETRRLAEFIGLEVPPYAILSHTWVSNQEVTFQEMRSPAGLDPTSASKSGWDKIDRTCRQAAEDNLKYVWVDTCCIDKTSSAELSEAINSMFRWYKRAAVCYVFLADLAGLPRSEDADELDDSIRHCRWFSRSWTLQELIAPLHIEFYDRDWDFCFTKEMASEALARITGIDVGILNHETNLSAVSVAQKMSWAATRQSTRIEDAAYSLVGIFGINMPLLYGEEERAFLRLQAEIISSCPDPTIFAWMNRPEPHQSDSYSGVMASSPLPFEDCAEVQRLSNQPLFEFSLSNRGIQLRAQFGLLPLRAARGSCLVLPVCEIQDKVFGIRVRNLGRTCFARQNAHELVHIKPWAVAHRLVLEPYLLKQIHPSSETERGTQDLIMESRNCVLEVTMSLRMEVYRRWPWQQWDEQDTLFFGSHTSSEDVGWASLKIVASPPYPFHILGASGTFDFLFYAFGWASHPGARPQPRYTIHRVRGGIDDRAMEQMNHEAVRDSWNAYWVANRLVSNGVAEQHCLVAATSGQKALLLVCTMHSVEDREISINPFWRAEFSWSVVRKDQVPEASNQSWTGINWGPTFNPPWDAMDDSS